MPRLPVCGVDERFPGPVIVCSTPPPTRNSPTPDDPAKSVNVLLLTVFVGIVLVSFFVGLFLHQTAGSRSVNERDALLPLDSETPTPATAKVPRRKVAQLPKR